MIYNDDNASFAGFKNDNCKIELKILTNQIEVMKMKTIIPKVLLCKCDQKMFTTLLYVNRPLFSFQIQKEDRTDLLFITSFLVSELSLDLF